MTVSMPFGRLLCTRIAPRNLHTVTRFSTSSVLPRVSSNLNASSNADSQSQCRPGTTVLVSGSRTYATAAKPKSPGRPKAHTGRTTAKPTTTRTGAKKAGSKKSTTKRKTAKKPKAKKVTKPKRAVKKPVSAAAQKRAAAAKTRDLKEKALLNPPKKLPSSAWQLVFAEARPKGIPITESANATKEAAARFRNLSPEERERYNHTANENKEKNEAALKRWLSSFSPEQILEANNARRQLAKIDQAKTKKKNKSSKFAPIQDDRTVKRPKSSFTYFSMDRRSSGDFAGMTLPEAARLIGREWKQATASEKKQFEDQAKADHNRYVMEYKSVYGKEPVSMKQKAAA